MRRYPLVAAFCWTLFLIAVVYVRALDQPPPSVGLRVKIARAATGVACDGDARLVVVRVMSGGLAQLNSTTLTLNELDRQLEQIMSTRAERVVFVSSNDNLESGEVIAVIDIATKHADYVSLITPDVESGASAPGGCLDANLNLPPILL